MWTHTPEATNRRRDMLEMFVECAPVGLAMFDRNMCYVQASGRWREECGIGDAELVGKSHYEIFTDLPEHWKAAHRRGLAGESLRAEEDWVAPDGKTHTIRWDIHPWGDPGAEPDGIIIFSEDITVQKEGERELRKFASLADNSPEFIGMCDMNFLPFYVNQAGMRLVGLDSLEQVRRTPVQEYLFPEDERFIIKEFFPRVLREGRAEVEIRMRHFRTGESLWMLHNVFIIQDATGRPASLPRAATSPNASRPRRRCVRVRSASGSRRRLPAWVPSSGTSRPA